MAAPSHPNPRPRARGRGNQGLAVRAAAPHGGPEGWWKGGPRTPSPRARGEGRGEGRSSDPLMSWQIQQVERGGEVAAVGDRPPAVERGRRPLGAEGGFRRHAELGSHVL